MCALYMCVIYALWMCCVCVCRYVCWVVCWIWLGSVVGMHVGSVWWICVLHMSVVGYVLCMC